MPGSVGEMPRSEDVVARPPSATLHWLEVVAIAAAVLFAYRPILELDFLGWDPFLVLLSCADRPGALLPLVVADPLADGMPFHRPVLKLSLCVDYALWGLEPAGFQRTSLVLTGACALALRALLARMLGSVHSWVPLLAALLFVLDPIQSQIVAFPARRGEPLCALFMLLALYGQLASRGGSRPGARFAALFVSGWLCVGAKETGYVLVPLAILLGWLFPGEPRQGRRLAGAVREALPALAAAVVAAITRIAVLGDVGGYSAMGLEHLDKVLPLARWLLFAARESVVDPVLVWTFVLAALLTPLALGWRDRVTRLSGAPRSERQTTEYRALVFAASFLGVSLLLHAFTGKPFQRYLFFPALGWDMLQAVALGSLVGAVADSPRLSGKGVSGLAAASVLALLLAQLTHALPWNDAVQRRLAHADGRLSGQLELLEDAIRETPEGAVTWRSLHPRAVYLHGRRLDTWLRLAYPDRAVRVVFVQARDAPVRPGPRERVVAIVVSPESGG